ncbi:MAG: hypothetical protein KC656_17520, partial [Myxococcales bacterium]|nr:hypothetical protein [Myxococcales bacterium]
DVVFLGVVVRFVVVWRYMLDSVVPPALVGTGFLKGSVLYTSLHADLPGVFVLDHHLYRVLPGATTAVRP